MSISIEQASYFGHIFKKDGIKFDWKNTSVTNTTPRSEEMKALLCWKTQEKETSWRKTEGQELVLETAYNK